MNNVYILGGPPRTAKTTILTGVAVEMRIPNISSDAINHGLRNVLTGKPSQMLRRIKLAGQAEHKTSVLGGGEMKPFFREGQESDFTLEAVIGMLDYYRKNGSSVAFEGSAFTPAWVARLDLEGFNVRAAFVGYTNASHADAVISHAYDNPGDWINVWLKAEGGNEQPIREWVAQEAVACKNLKKAAETHGYPFFDISSQPFETYKSAVLDYFLES